MNVDTQFPQAPAATLPSRPLPSRTDQASARPVDRPHHNEPADNQSRQNAGQTEAHKETPRPSGEARSLRQESEAESNPSHARQTDTRFDPSSQPAPVGELLDVLA